MNNLHKSIKKEQDKKKNKKENKSNNIKLNKINKKKNKKNNNEPVKRKKIKLNSKQREIPNNLGIVNNNPIFTNITNSNNNLFRNKKKTKRSSLFKTQVGTSNLKNNNIITLQENIQNKTLKDTDKRENVKYIDIELNLLSYTQALINDKRSYW